MFQADMVEILTEMHLKAAGKQAGQVVFVHMQLPGQQVKGQGFLIVLSDILDQPESEVLAFRLFAFFQGKQRDEQGKEHMDPGAAKPGAYIRGTWRKRILSLGKSQQAPEGKKNIFRKKIGGQKRGGRTILLNGPRIRTGHGGGENQKLAAVWDAGGIAVDLFRKDDSAIPLAKKRGLFHDAHLQDAGWRAVTGECATRSAKMWNGNL